MNQRKAREVRKAAEEAGPGATVRTTASRRLLWGVVGAVVVAALVGGILAARGSGPAQAVSRSSGSQVSFSGEDPVTGRTVSTADYAGKPLVINVWGSWCEGCSGEAADLRTFVETHPEVQVIGLDLQDSKSGARSFYAEWKWRHPSVSDPKGEISFMLGLQGTPTTFFLDEDHRIVTRIVGETDRAGFEEGLRQALAAS